MISMGICEIILSILSKQEETLKGVVLMYKMVVIDLDGTLLNEEQLLSPGNVKAIHYAQEKGVKIVLASGRSYTGMYPYIEQLQLTKANDYAITCSGSMILNNQTKEIVCATSLTKKDVLLIHQICKDLDLEMSAYSKDKILVSRENLFSRYDARTNYTTLEIVDFHNLDESTEIYKINIINEDHSILNELVSYFPRIQLQDIHIDSKKNFNKDLLDSLHLFPKALTENFTVVKPLDFCLEVLCKSCNKSVGVDYLAKLFNFERSEIIAIGDSGNDEHMLKDAGLGIAMGNASPYIKEIADGITLSNQEDGVAHVIYKYL